MSAPMKKHLTEEVNLTFAGPGAMIEAALEAMEGLGFKAVSNVVSEAGDAIDWRSSHHYSDHAKRPGQILAGARFREGLTQVALAELTSIPRRHISEMENGRRPIGKSNARKLAKALNVDPRRFLTI